MNQLKPAIIGFDLAWLLVDPLTVDQAAALWCGKEPESKMLGSSRLGDDPKLAVVRQMLVSAVKAGVLPAELRLGAFAMGWFGEALVTREALRRFAIFKHPRLSQRIVTRDEFLCSHSARASAQEIAEAPSAKKVAARKKSRQSVFKRALPQWHPVRKDELRTA